MPTRSTRATRHAFPLLALALALGVTSANGQVPVVPGVQEMRRLAPLVGEWEGTGWVQLGPNGRQPFTVHESARWAAGGTVLVLDGLGLTKLDDGSERPAHEAFAVVSWDPAGGRYRMRAYRAGAGEVEDTPTVSDGGLVWGFSDPRGGRVRFTLSFDDRGWHEVGELSPDGVTWRPFLEMHLERAGASPPGA